MVSRYTKAYWTWVLGAFGAIFTIIGFAGLYEANLNGYALSVVYTFDVFTALGVLALFGYLWLTYP